MTAANNRTGGMIFGWLRDVDDHRHADESLTHARRQAIMLVAVARALHANPDGSNCYPSQSTVARFAGVDRVTVRAVDEWLAERGLMAMTRNSGRGTSRRFRLTLHPLKGGDHHQSTEPRKVATTTNQAVMNGGQDGGQEGGGHHHNLQTSERSEEVEGERYAPSRPEAGPTHALSADQKDQARQLVTAAMASKPDAYRQLDPYHDAMLAEGHRLHAGGWLPAQIAARIVDLPDKPKYSATGLVAKKLTALPDEPDIDVEEIDDAEPAGVPVSPQQLGDPKYWATLIANEIITHETDDVWQQASHITDDTFNAAVAWNIVNEELQSGPELTREAYDLVNDRSLSDEEKIRRLALKFTSRSMSVTDREHAEQLESIYEDLTAVVATTVSQVNWL